MNKFTIPIINIVVSGYVVTVCLIYLSSIHGKINYLPLLSLVEVLMLSPL